MGAGLAARFHVLSCPHIPRAVPISFWLGPQGCPHVPSVSPRLSPCPLAVPWMSPCPLSVPRALPISPGCSHVPLVVSPGLSPCHRADPMSPECPHVPRAVSHVIGLSAMSFGCPHILLVSPCPHIPRLSPCPLGVPWLSPYPLAVPMSPGLSLCLLAFPMPPWCPLGVPWLSPHPSIPHPSP